MKKIGCRGQSSAVDLGLFLIIVVMAIGFLQIYSATHTSTNIKNYRDQLMDEYAQHTLLSLSYLPAEGADYETIQPDTMEYVYHKSLESAVNATKKIRNYSRFLDNKIENWSKNLTSSYLEMKKDISSMKANITLLQTELNTKTSELTEAINSINADCGEVSGGINSYGDLIGGDHISDDSCVFVEELGDVVSSTTIETNGLLTGVYNQLSIAEDNLDLGADAVMRALNSVRCLLQEINVKLDYFISYAQLGVKENPNLLDLMPAKARISSKTLTESIGEALYIEDRLAGSSILGTVAAAGTRLELEKAGRNPDEPSNRILQGVVLSYGRTNYLRLAEQAVKNKLDVMLSAQGYNYCFTATDCCNQITAGDCASIPYNTAKASRSINTLNNQSANITLDIWRK